MKWFRRKTKVEIRMDIYELDDLKKALEFIKKLEKEHNCHCTLLVDL